MDTVVAKYQWTAAELTKAIRWHHRQSARPVFRAVYWAMIVVMIILTGVSAIWLILTGKIRDGAILGGIALTLFILPKFSTPLSAWYLFRRSPERKKEIEWRLSPGDIQIVSPRGTIQADWGLLIRVVECADGLLFYFGPRAFNWLPRTGFANEAEYASAVMLARQNCQTFVRCDRTLLQGFRFTIRNILWAMFWMCIWAGTLSYLIAFVNAHRPVQGLPWRTTLFSIWIPLFLAVWLPAVAIGALFNNARAGALAGLIPVAFIVILALMVAI